MLRAVVNANRRWSKRITPAHFEEANVHSMFAKISSILISPPDTIRVLDAGAGSSWFLPRDYKPRYGLYLIGADIDLEELEQNEALDEKIVCDVCTNIPIEDGSIDLITAFSGIEHFPNNLGFLQECYRTLRPGGRLVAQFPGRYAPFAVLNRSLPERMKRFLLKVLIPGSEGVLGFKAFYDRTNYSAFSRIARTAGFDIEYHFPGYFSSDYFAFCLPLYIVSLVFDLLRFSVGAKNLASYNLFVLVKPGPSACVAFRPYHVRLSSLSSVPNQAFEGVRV